MIENTILNYQGQTVFPAYACACTPLDEQKMLDEKIQKLREKRALRQQQTNEIQSTQNQMYSINDEVQQAQHQLENRFHEIDQKNHLIHENSLMISHQLGVNHLVVEQLNEKSQQLTVEVDQIQKAQQLVQLIVTDVEQKREEIQTQEQDIRRNLIVIKNTNQLSMGVANQMNDRMVDIEQTQQQMQPAIQNILYTHEQLSHQIQNVHLKIEKQKNIELSLQKQESKKWIDTGYIAFLIKKIKKVSCQLILMMSHAWKDSKSLIFYVFYHYKAAFTPSIALNFFSSRIAAVFIV